MFSFVLVNTPLEEIGHKIGIPLEVTIYGLIPFVFVFLLSLLSSVLFVEHFWEAEAYNQPSAILATLGILIALLTATLLPVDVFLMSVMKNENGTFKNWAADNITREKIEDGVSYTYFTFYGIMLFFIFFLLPLEFFAHRKQDESSLNSDTKRLAPSLKFTAIFVVAAILLLVTGAFLPYPKMALPIEGASVKTEDISHLREYMYNNRFVDGVLFALNVLMLIGMMFLIVYLGVGMSFYPVKAVWGFQSLRDMKTKIVERKDAVIAKIERLQEKGGNLSSREGKALTKLQNEERRLSHLEIEVSRGMSSMSYKLQFCGHFFKIIAGIIAFILGFLIWLSILLTNIYRLMDSYGYLNGYISADPKIPGPLNSPMMALQKVYPVDYFLFFGVVVLLVICAIVGVRYVGIRFCFPLPFQIIPHETHPQAMIMLCAILMLTVLGLNIIVSCALPHYMAFGNQKYVEYNETTGEGVVKTCSVVVSKDLCVMTRAYIFLLHFTVKMPSFGVLYFGLTWIFLVVVILGFFIAIMKQKQSKRSNIQSALESAKTEETNSDSHHLVSLN